MIHPSTPRPMGVINLGSNTGPYNLAHIEVQGNGVGNCLLDSISTDGIYSNNDIAQKGLHIDNTYIHEISRNGLTVGNLVGASYSDYGMLFENNVISHVGLCDSSGGIHTQSIQLGYQSNQNYIIIRNNSIFDSFGTAQIAALGVSSTNRNILIYNNIFRSTNRTLYYSSPAVIYFHSGAQMETTNVSVYNNIFYNMGVMAPTVYNYGGILNDSSLGSNNTAANNIWSDDYIPYVGTAGNGFTMLNNDYYNNIGSGVLSPGGTNQFEVSSPFVNAVGGDFHLVSASKAINAGVNLSGIFNNDKDGNPRPSTGPWTIGAYEYIGGGTVTPPPPTPIVGDFDHNGIVNSLDLSLLAGAWNTNNSTYDLNHDGIANSLDYVIMVQNWSM